MREYAALIVIGSWLAFAPVVVARVAHLFGQTTRRRTRSMLGIALVTIGFAFVRVAAFRFWVSSRAATLGDTNEHRPL